MIKEDKILLRKELCARLYYNPIVCATGWEKPIRLNSLDINRLIFSNIYPPKPYLRSVSSMTEEEKEEYFNICDEDLTIAVDAMTPPYIIEDNKGNHSSGLVPTNELEFMYKHHFDFPRKQDDGSYKTLTELGLALEAHNGMYNN